VRRSERAGNWPELLQSYSRHDGKVMQRRRINMAVLLLLAMAATDAASAQTNYPNSSVRVISDSGQAVASTSLCASSLAGWAATGTSKS